MRLVCASLFLLAVLGGTAAAGQKVGGTVGVYPSLRYAAGGLGAARNSPDAYQDIGCMTQVSAGGTTRAVCWATDNKNTHALCSSTDPKIVSVAQSVNSDSWIGFYYDAAGTCTTLMSYTKSSLEPKQ